MRRARLLPLLLVPLLAACGSGASNDTSAAAEKAEAPQASAGLGVARDAAAAPEPVQRQVVRKATIAVTVKDVPAAADRAVALAERAGGRVDSDRRTAAGKGSATLVLRVPPAAVEATLSGLAKLGKEHDRGIDDEDVTVTAVDLASRIATQRASVERVRALLDRAQSLSDVTKVESELTRRQSDLESLLARQKALSGQVELATVSATLSGDGTPVAAGKADRAGFVDGLSAGWDALVGTARVVAVVTGALLPFSWVLLLLVAARLVVRRRKAPAV